jgi:hypothetical protein
MEVTLKITDNWEMKVNSALDAALATSINVVGRTGYEACRHAMILMMQSARALAKQAPKNRKTMRDEKGQYVEFYASTKKQTGSYRAGEFTKFYKWAFDDGSIPGTWEDIRRIGNRGLAKRSWMWGANKLRGKSGSKEMSGASDLYTVARNNVGGFVKVNRLNYILKTMPAGWAQTVESRAANKIMAQARIKLERDWQRQVTRRGLVIGKTIGDFFKGIK